MEKHPFHRLWTRHYCAAFFILLLSWNAGEIIAGAEPLPAPPLPKQAQAGAPSSAGEETELPEVQVTDKKEVKPQAKEGSAEAGYRSTTATVGPLGNMPLQDTPYSISVTSSDFIENIQASNPTDALRYNPTVNPEMGSNRSGDYLSIRGFINSTNQAVEGLRQDLGFGIFLEDKERVEVLSGTDSFLYGISSPAGMVNYVLKRPTAVPMLKVTLGDYGGGQAYAHVDAGGPIDGAGKFGYRINLLGVAHGDTGIDHETNERYLASGAFDWHIAPNTLWSFDVSNFNRKLENMQAFFKYAAAVTKIPDAPNASTNYAAPYNGDEYTYSTYGTKITSDINNNVSVRSAFRYSSTIADGFRSMRDVWTNNAGNYNQQMMYYDGRTKETTIQGNLFADLSFSTGFVKHKVTAGYGIDDVNFYSTSPGTSTHNFPAATLFKMSNPGYSPYPVLSPPITTGGSYQNTEQTIRQSILLADQVTFNKNWSLLVGCTYASIDDNNYAYTGVTASDNNKAKFTPSAAITFKPDPAVTTYVSFSEAVSEGPVASQGININQALSPFLSTQVELGAKALIGNMSVNAAVFRIEETNGYAYLNSATNVYTEDGNEVHIGGEFSFSGKVTDELTLLGGFTILSAEIKSTQEAGATGKTPQAVPDSMARLYGEYAVPQLPGFILTGGISYTGREWVNDTNTLSIPYVITGDVGARYKLKVFEKDTTLRLSVNNVTDENYWTSKGGGMLYLGSPRTITASATVQF